MGNKVFVGGLSWGTSDDSLKEGFEQFGAVRDAKVITDRDTGRSRGFGFVTFQDVVSAKKAIDEMDGQEFEGRRVQVNEAKDRR